MADKENKLGNNVAGSYYVDADCIACGMCHEIAPEFFLLDADAGTAYVGNQPADDAGKAACQEAMSSCPVEAIGDDGE